MIKSHSLIVLILMLIWLNVAWSNHGATEHHVSTPCAECHGINGVNKTLSGPNLAGQNIQYLIKQIKSFYKGDRDHPLLNSNNFILEKNEIVELANYYTNLQPDNSATNMKVADIESLFSQCSACHGAQGEGIAPFPRLSGQKPDYLEQQLINFKTGVRKSVVMKMMVINLSDHEIKQLATYLGTLQASNATVASEKEPID